MNSGNLYITDRWRLKGTDEPLVSTSFGRTTLDGRVEVHDFFRNKIVRSTSIALLFSLTRVSIRRWEQAFCRLVAREGDPTFMTLDQLTPLVHAAFQEEIDHVRAAFPRSSSPLPRVQEAVDWSVLKVELDKELPEAIELYRKRTLSKKRELESDMERKWNWLSAEIDTCDRALKKMRKVEETS